MKHTHTHTYTHTNEITAVQKKKVKESDPASKGSQKLYQPIKRKLTKCKLENQGPAVWHKELSVMWQMGKGFGGKWIHFFVWLSPFAVHMRLPQHC